MKREHRGPMFANDEELAELEAQAARERDVTDAIVRILGAGHPVDFERWARHRGIVVEAPRWSRVVRRWEAKHRRSDTEVLRGVVRSWAREEAEALKRNVDALAYAWRDGSWDVEPPKP